MKTILLYYFRKGLFWAVWLVLGIGVFGWYSLLECFSRTGSARHAWNKTVLVYYLTKEHLRL